MIHPSRPFKPQELLFHILVKTLVLGHCCTVWEKERGRRRISCRDVMCHNAPYGTGVFFLFFFIFLCTGFALQIFSFDYIPFMYEQSNI